MTYPDALREILDKAIAGKPSDVDGAAQWVLGQWQQRPEYHPWVQAIVRRELRSLVNGLMEGK